MCLAKKCFIYKCCHFLYFSTGLFFFLIYDWLCGVKIGKFWGAEGARLIGGDCCVMFTPAVGHMVLWCFFALEVQALRNLFRPKTDPAHVSFCCTKGFFSRIVIFQASIIFTWPLKRVKCVLLSAELHFHFVVHPQYMLVSRRIDSSACLRINKSSSSSPDKLNMIF